MLETLGSDEFTSLFKKADDATLGKEFDPFETSKPTQLSGADYIGNVPAPKPGVVPLASGKKEVKPTVLPGTSTKTQQSGQNPLTKKDWQHKSDDDQMAQDSKDHEECHENHEENQECEAVDQSGMAVDDNVVAAVDFTISHLTKIASALDNNGFAGLANIIDETIKRVAAKK
jgi:hypothetical protein